MSRKNSNFARGLGVLAWISAAATVAGALYLTANSDALIAIASRKSGLTPEGAVGFLGRGLVWFTMILGAGLVLFVLTTAARLFALHARGAALSADAARALTRIGVGLTLAALLQLIAPTLVGLGLTLDNAPGHRMLVLSLDGTAIGLFLAGGLMALVGVSTRHAAQQAEELRGIV